MVLFNGVFFQLRFPYQDSLRLKGPFTERRLSLKSDTRTIKSDSELFEHIFCLQHIFFSFFQEIPDKARCQESD